MGTFTIRLSCGAGGPVFPKMVEGCLRAGEGRLILIGAFLPVGVQTGGAIKGTTMAWTTPTLVEICIGLEINGYLPAEF